MIFCKSDIMVLEPLATPWNGLYFGDLDPQKPPSKDPDFLQKMGV